MNPFFRVSWSSSCHPRSSFRLGRRPNRLSWRRGGLVGRRRLQRALARAIREALAVLLGRAAVLRAGTGELRREWVFELFGEAPQFARWQVEAVRLIERASSSRATLEPLSRLLAVAPTHWPTSEELLTLARTYSDSAAVARLSLEARLRADEDVLARIDCENLLFVSDDAWGAWVVLGHLHRLEGSVELAQAAFEAAAEVEECGVDALVESLALGLAGDDEKLVRRAAARLELLISPEAPEFLRAITRLERRGSPRAGDSKRWLKLFGARASAATLVLRALA